jgi:branched-chain amino acid transport system substrate-binding protein
MAMLYNRKNIVLSLYVIILASIGPLVFWLSNRQGYESLHGQFSQFLSSWWKGSMMSPVSLDRKLSQGEEVLITANTNPQKQAGVIAFGKGDYTMAIDRFQKSLKIERNDPETLIYLNNAKAARSGKILRIATIAPISSNLNVAKEILRGVAQAQDEINNRGGIDGKLIEVEIANDENNPDTAREIAQNLVRDKDILTVIGHNSSDATIAAAPVYQKGGLVTISPTSVAKELSGIGSFIFRTTPNTRNLADRLADYTVRTAHKTKVAICSDSQSEASKSFKEEFIWSLSELGARVAPTVCDFSAKNFNPQELPSQAIGDGADAILLIPAVDKIHQAIEVARANHNRLVLLGSHTMYTFETLQTGQQDVKGMVLAAIWHPDVNPQSSFVRDTIKYWGGAGSWRTATSYDATKVTIEALKQGTQRDRIQQTLANPDFSVNGATGIVRFLPSGDRLATGVSIQIQAGKNSGTGLDFALIRPEPVQPQGDGQGETQSTEQNRTGG